ncbi:MAG: zf-HC2 domain-containing protein, partial [Actinomycetota bacterium]
MGAENRQCVSEVEAVAFVSGAVGESELAGIEAHVDACPDCRTLLVALARCEAGAGWPDDAHGTGTTVGRFVLIDVLGEGASSVVYSAYDPVLDRRRQELGAFTSLVAAGVDAPTMDRAVGSALELVPASVCSDKKALAEILPPPDDPARRKQVAAAAERVDGVRALDRLG